MLWPGTRRRLERPLASCARLASTHQAAARLAQRVQSGTSLPRRARRRARRVRWDSTTRRCLNRRARRVAPDSTCDVFCGCVKVVWLRWSGVMRIVAVLDSVGDTGVLVCVW